MKKKSEKPAARRGGGDRPSEKARINAYLAACPEPHRTSLAKIRAAILSAAPSATEVIYYQMPAIHQGAGVICYAAFRNHCSLFPMSVGTRRDFAVELAKYPGGAGTIQFPPGKPPPATLIRRIVKARLAEIAAAAEARKAKKKPAKAKGKSSA